MMFSPKNGRVNQFNLTLMGQVSCLVIKQVQKRFKDHQPGLIYTRCVAHRLELAVLVSIKTDDNYLTVFDENKNSIFRYYYYSANFEKS